MKKSVMLNRFLLVSDMHYTTEEMGEALRKSYPEAIASAAAGNAFGRTQREKIERIYEDICNEDRRHKLDAVLVLGDLSIDDPPYRKLPRNYCLEFKKDCMDRLPCPVYAMPGNHDSYTDKQWQEIFGYGRQYVVEAGDCVFIMADTFAALPATGASGSGESPLDAEFLKDCLERYQGKKIFLCAHYLETDSDKHCSFTEDVRKLLADNKDLVCMFRAHTHVNCALDMYGYKIIDVGGYGYAGQIVNGKWDFNIFDPQWAWGYQVLEVYEDHIRTYHVKPAMEYVATNGTFSIPEMIEDDMTL